MKQMILTMMYRAVEKYGDFPHLANKSDEGRDKSSF